MTGLWTYPWDFPDSNRESSLETLAEAGVDRLKVAAHYHSVRTLNPKALSRGFETFPGGCLFDPDEAEFEGTPIDPPRNTVDGRSDSFEAVVSAAADRGFDVDAWVVCNHGTRLANRHPAYAMEDAFGGAHSHALCPSHPEVRTYLAAIVRSVSRTEVNRVDLESLGFPSVRHPHGPEFGHHKDHVLTDRTREFLVSQCFCGGCRRAAEGAVDVKAARETVSTLCQRYLSRPAGETPSLADLVAEHPVLEGLFEVRRTVIEDLLARLERASSETRLSYYVADGGRYTPAELWPSGVTPALLEEYVDDITALCYTGDPEEIDRRVTACRDALEHPIDAGVTVDPAVVDGRTDWQRLTDRAAEQVDGTVFVYNYGLMTADHLEWLADLDVRPV